MLFFPHLIAGPILRPNELIPQLEHPRRKKMVLPTAGVAVFTLGLVKKLVIADPIGGLVDHGLMPRACRAPRKRCSRFMAFRCRSIATSAAIPTWRSGSRSARHPAAEQFPPPYCAGLDRDFWRRWHITLSFWLRDYLYIPLGGNRQGRARQIRNILIPWRSAVYGMAPAGPSSFGACFTESRSAGVHLFRRLRTQNPQWLGVALTFCLVTFAWVYFRAPDHGDCHTMFWLARSSVPWPESDGFADVAPV